MKPTKNKDIIFSVIIVSYNNLGVLRNCLDSVIAMNDIGNALEIIVVEQSPNDEIYNYLIKAYPEVITIRAENKGFGAGNNIGVDYSNGKYLFFLNPDTVLLEPVAGYAVSIFENDKSLGLFGVQLLNKDKKRASSFDMMIPYGFLSRVVIKICASLNYYNENTMYIQGADMFIPRSVFDSVGRFDDSVFMYFEEADLCTRIKREGYHIAFWRKKKIVHLQGACTAEKTFETTIKQLEAFSHFCDKNDINVTQVIDKEIRYLLFRRLFSWRGSNKYKTISERINACTCFRQSAGC